MCLARRLLLKGGLLHVSLAPLVCTKYLAAPCSRSMPCHAAAAMLSLPTSSAPPSSFPNQPRPCTNVCRAVSSLGLLFLVLEALTVLMGSPAGEAAFALACNPRTPQFPWHWQILLLSSYDSNFTHLL